MWKFAPKISDKLFRTILLPFVITGAIGLTLSMVAHISSLFGISLPGGKLIWVLHMAIFVVWLPGIFVANRMAAKATNAEYWNAVFSGCPHWMKTFVYIIFIYSFLIMIFAMVNTWAAQPSPKGDAPPEIILLFSGGWLAFYSAGLAALYSAYRLGYSAINRTCANGHSVALMARYCDECGASLPKFP